MTAQRSVQSSSFRVASLCLASLRLASLRHASLRLAGLRAVERYMKAIDEGLCDYLNS